MTREEKSKMLIGERVVRIARDGKFICIQKVGNELAQDLLDHATEISIGTNEYLEIKCDTGTTWVFPNQELKSIAYS